MKRMIIFIVVVVVLGLSGVYFLNLQHAKKIPVSKDAEGKFCGGIAANLPEFQCPQGYYCKLEGNHPDATGVCVRR